VRLGTRTWGGGAGDLWRSRGGGHDVVAGVLMSRLSSAVTTDGGSPWKSSSARGRRDEDEGGHALVEELVDRSRVRWSFFFFIAMSVGHLSY
jgi:hypothetical protein